MYSEQCAQRLLLKLRRSLRSRGFCFYPILRAILVILNIQIIRCLRSDVFAWGLDHEVLSSGEFVAVHEAGLVIALGEKLLL